jgi:hypothetical protein
LCIWSKLSAALCERRLAIQAICISACIHLEPQGHHSCCHCRVCSIGTYALSTSMFQHLTVLYRHCILFHRIQCFKILVLYQAFDTVMCISNTLPTSIQEWQLMSKDDSRTACALQWSRGNTSDCTRFSLMLPYVLYSTSMRMCYISYTQSTGPRVYCPTTTWTCSSYEIMGGYSGILISMISL